MVSPFSLSSLLYLLASSWLDPSLSRRWIESRSRVDSARGRVFQASCRLPPPWINTRIARATSLSLSLAQPLLPSAPLSLSSFASRSPSTNPQLLFVARTLSLSLLLFFSLFLSHLLSFIFSFSFSLPHTFSLSLLFPHALSYFFFTTLSLFLS